MGPDFRWEGIDDLPYKPEEGGWCGVIRRPLIGKGGESTQFHLRYFEISPGGMSSLERHRHEHVVVGLRGEGEVRIDGETHPVRFGDVVYVGPDAVHRFRNPSREPFGFLCIVDAERDQPRPVETDGDG
jgi:ribulose-bisphosphate carboxylase large chain